MNEKIYNGDNGLATLLRSEIVAGYKTLKITKMDEFTFSFQYNNEVYRVFINKDYGMWCCTLCKNWESRHNPGTCFLDRRAFNLTPDYKAIRWSNEVIGKCVELIEKAIA